MVALVRFTVGSSSCTQSLLFESLCQLGIVTLKHQCGGEVLGLVGVYAIEEDGIKLFESIGSDLFSIQGISLIQLTQFLWENNLLFKNNGA